MKLEIEVYNLGELLYHVRNNKIESFQPKALRITSTYQGYTGDNWGDNCGGKGGFPIIVEYSDSDGKEWFWHKKLFRTKEELVEDLTKKT